MFSKPSIADAATRFTAPDSTVTMIPVTLRTHVLLCWSAGMYTDVVLVSSRRPASVSSVSPRVVMDLLLNECSAALVADEVSTTWRVLHRRRLNDVEIEASVSICKASLHSVSKRSRFRGAYRLQPTRSPLQQGNIGSVALTAVDEVERVVVLVGVDGLEVGDVGIAACGSKPSSSAALFPRRTGSRTSSSESSPGSIPSPAADENGSPRSVERRCSVAGGVGRVIGVGDEVLRESIVGERSTLGRRRPNSVLPRRVSSLEPESFRLRSELVADEDEWVRNGEGTCGRGLRPTAGPGGVRLTGLGGSGRLDAVRGQLPLASSCSSCAPSYSAARRSRTLSGSSSLGSPARSVRVGPEKRFRPLVCSTGESDSERSMPPDMRQENLRYSLRQERRSASSNPPASKSLAVGRTSRSGAGVEVGIAQTSFPLSMLEVGEICGRLAEHRARHWSDADGWMDVLFTIPNHSAQRPGSSEIKHIVSYPSTLSRLFA